jgi:hypothetical protein
LRIADRELKIDEIVGAAERELCLFDRGARSVCQPRGMSARAVLQQWCAFPSPNRPGLSCSPATPGVFHGPIWKLENPENPENP